METSIEQIVKEWSSNLFLKKYSEIGKDYLAKQNKSKETI